MKEFAIVCFWLMTAVACISITVSILLAPLMQANKEKETEKAFKNFFNALIELGNKEEVEKDTKNK